MHKKVVVRESHYVHLSTHTCVRSTYHGRTTQGEKCLAPLIHYIYLKLRLLTGTKFSGFALISI